MLTAEEGEFPKNPKLLLLTHLVHLTLLRPRLIGEAWRYRSDVQRNCLRMFLRFPRVFHLAWHKITENNRGEK